MEGLLGSVGEFLTNYETTLILVLGGIVEVALRLFKSDKIVSIPRLVARFLGLIGGLLERLAGLIDQAVPDRPAE